MSSLTYPNTLFYTKEHVWVQINDDNTATIGITDFAQDQLGEVAYVDLPAVGKSFTAGAEFGTVESIKSVSDLYMPIQGTVLASNELLGESPTLVNMSPYQDGWMLKLSISPDADRSLFISAEDYQQAISA